MTSIVYGFSEDMSQIISLEQAKNWLGGIDFDDDDDAIQRLIASAITWVEQYTGYRLYPREETIIATGTTTYITLAPFKITSAVDENEEVVYLYEKWVSANRLRVLCPAGTKISLTVGFDDAKDAPGPLVEACYKLITYLYENRDVYSAGMPTDIQMLINPFRRSLA